MCGNNRLIVSQGTLEMSAYMYMVKMEINGEMLMIEIYMGAAVSNISKDTYWKKLGFPEVFNDNLGEIHPER